MELVTYLGQGRGGVTPATPLKVADFSMFLGVMAETTARPTKYMSSTLVGLLLCTKLHTFLVFFFLCSRICANIELLTLLFVFGFCDKV